MRLLLIAPLADGASTGESWISFQWLELLSRRHDVTVLSYRPRRGRPLAPQLPRARVIEWVEPPLIGAHERFAAMVKPGNPPFRWRAHRWIRRALASGERFDIAHQLAPVSLRYSSPVTGTGIPFVLGPVGGSLASPPAFVAEEGGTPWFVSLRRLDAWRLHHDRALRRTVEEAACVLGIADYVRESLEGLHVADFRVLSDMGIYDLPEPSPGSDRTHGVRALFVGRIVRTKGVRDAIRAMGYVPAGVVTLDVVGQGYDRTACEELATALGVADRVRFHGAVPHEHVAAFYDAADLFLFPSYREAGGIVVVEAMSHGLPVVVCDRGGPASSVDEASGIRVPARDPEQYAHALASAICTLAAEPARRKAMGRAARQRIASIGLWEHRVELVERLYQEVLGR